MDIIRIGQVSSVNYAAGMIQVVYMDRSGSTTGEIPYFSFNDEYKMPKKEDMVLVLHLANGSAAGVVLGKFWNAQNVPQEGGEGVFRKELGNTVGEAYLAARNGAVTLYGGTLELADSGGSITVSGLLSRLSGIEKRLSALEAAD